MKLFNKLYLIIFVALAFACDPYGERFQEIEENLPGPISNTEIELTDDDYELLEGVEGAENAAQYGNFDNEDDVREFIPIILNEKYPLFDNGSAVNVMYDFYNPIYISNIVEYTVTEADYESVGGNAAQYGNFDSENQITGFLSSKYPNANNRTSVLLTYEFYNGSFTDEVTNYFYYFGGSWYSTVELSSDDYDYMGQRFPNFDDSGEAMNRIGVWLEDEFKFETFEEGDRKVVIYTYTYVDDNDDRQFEDRVLIYNYSGNEWVAQQSTTQRSLQFGKEEGMWIPDNTIAYTLTGADYELIGSIEVENGNTARGENVQNFGNFYQNFPGGDTHWTPEEIASIIGQFLLEKFPNSEVGQKYNVTYLKYVGSAVEDNVLLILTEDGTYQVVE